MQDFWNLIACDIFASERRYNRKSFSTRQSALPVFLPGQWGKVGGEPRCLGECTNHDSRLTHWYQCDKPGKVRLANGTTWCGIHGPEGVAKRHAAQIARDAASAAKWAARQKSWTDMQAQKTAFPRLVDALNAIAAGHNDPRTLAREALGEFLKEPTE